MCLCVCLCAFMSLSFVVPLRQRFFVLVACPTAFSRLEVPARHAVPTPVPLHCVLDGLDAVREAAISLQVARESGDAAAEDGARAALAAAVSAVRGLPQRLQQDVHRVGTTTLADDVLTVARLRAAVETRFHDGGVDDAVRGPVSRAAVGRMSVLHAPALLLLSEVRRFVPGPLVSVSPAAAVPFTHPLSYPHRCLTPRSCAKRVSSASSVGTGTLHATRQATTPCVCWRRLCCSNCFVHCLPRTPERWRVGKSRPPRL